jgi:hypothetical protein
MKEEHVALTMWLYINVCTSDIISWKQPGAIENEPWTDRLLKM